MGTPKASLLQRSDRRGSPARLQKIPVGKQFICVQFGPRFDQALLSSRKRAGNKSDRGNGNHGDMLLIIRVE